MAKTIEHIPETPLKWGQMAGLCLVAAWAAVHAPEWLLYAGLLRFVWCLVGGQAGRGLLSLLMFSVAYVGVAWWV